MKQEEDVGGRFWLPFLAGALAGGAGLVLARALTAQPPLDPALVRRRGEGRSPRATVVVPGILGSELLRPDGAQVWLNAGNALGHHDLALPATLPVGSGRDDLQPGCLVGTEKVLPRLFGFTEYPDLVDLLHATALPHHIFAYDWRRDLVESAGTLGRRLDELAARMGDEDATFNVVGHSMGGLVARYYLRFGDQEPGEGMRVSWAGARRIGHLVLVATPNSGSVTALDAVLNGDRVGLSFTTLAASVIATMPSIYELLPPAGVPALLDERLKPMALDLHEPSTWERFGWGPFGSPRRRVPLQDSSPSPRRDFLEAALGRARAFHLGLSLTPDGPCPTRVTALGGDCLPTLARGIVGDGGGSPRFEPRSRAETEVMLEAGDGRVTRASVLGSDLPEAADSDIGAGFPEITTAFFGSADHHGIYREATFQSVLLRALMAPHVSRLRPMTPRAEGAQTARMPLRI